jgi:hypothetical protein
MRAHTVALASYVVVVVVADASCSPTNSPSVDGSVPDSATEGGSAEGGALDGGDAASNLCATGIAANTVNTCALKSDGTVWCFGSGDIGNGSGAGSATWVQVLGLPPDVVDVQSYPEAATTCALTSSGNLWCWGANSQGTAGNGLTNAEQTIAVQALISNVARFGIGGVDGLNPYTTISVWAVDTSGGAWGWGFIPASLTTNPTQANPTTPQRLNAVIHDVSAMLVDLSNISYHYRVYVTHTDGSIEAMIYNQPGIGPNNCAVDAGLSGECDYLDPNGFELENFWQFDPGYTQVDGGSDIVLDGVKGPFSWNFYDRSAYYTSVADEYSFCATSGTGTLVCWGNAGFLGNGGKLNDAGDPMSVLLANPSMLSTVGSVQRLLNTNGNPYTGNPASDAIICVLNVTSQIWCWGSNLHLQAGNGADNSGILVPVQPTAVSGFTGATALTLGRTHTCALDMSGEPWCWGTIPTAGSTLSYPIPQQMPKLCP